MRPCRPPFEHEFQYALLTGSRVVAARDLLGRDGRQVHGAMRVVDGLARIRQHERRRRLLARVVAGVGLRHREAVLERLAALRDTARIVERLARVTAVADHVQPAVPRRRQIHLERDLGRQHPGHAAVLRSVAVRRDRRRRDLDDVGDAARGELLARSRGLADRRRDTRPVSCARSRTAAPPPSAPMPRSRLR